MKTRCPRCDARLELDPADHESVVRCPDCMSLLLSPTLPAPPTDWEPQPLPEALEPPAPPAEDETIVLATADEASATHPDERPAATFDDPAPAAAQQPPATRRPSAVATLLWALLAMFLIVLLAAQLVVHQRERLAVYPQLRPALSRLCDAFGCELAPYRAPQALALLEHHVLSHPTTTGALLIQATIINRAPLPQPYPLLELRFTDVQGRVVGQRQFRPDEYLPNADIAGHSMPVDTPVEIELELVDPGDEALAYEFDLLY